MGDRTWSSVIFNAVIVAGFIVMVMTVMHSKNLNKALSDEIEQATADFQVFRDKSEVCFKQLDAKNNEINTKYVFNSVFSQTYRGHYSFL